MAALESLDHKSVEFRQMGLPVHDQKKAGNPQNDKNLWSAEGALVFDPYP